MPKRFDVKRQRRAGESDEDEPEPEDCVVCDQDSIFFYSEVNTRSVVQLLKALREAGNAALERCSWPSEAKIYLYIHSGGGDALAGLSAADHIRCSRVPVVTIADGFVASAATFMLCAGAERKAFSSAKVLIHQISTSFYGRFAELQDELCNTSDLMTTMKSVYTTTTNMTADEIEKLLKKEKHLNAGEALQKGFVDEIW
jgi:ATP-dependent Clp endopeptidase proteolytic subunit ClpP